MSAAEEASSQAEEAETIEYEVIASTNTSPLPMNQEALVRQTGDRRRSDAVDLRDIKKARSMKQGGRAPAVIASCFVDCEETYLDAHGNSRLKRGRRCLSCGKAKYYVKKDAWTTDAYNAEKMAHHIATCNEVSYEIVCALVQEGCRAKAVVNRKEKMEQGRAAKRKMSAPPDEEPPSKCLVVQPDAPLVPHTPSHSRSSKQSNLSNALISCTPTNASTILFFITRWLLGSASSFRTVECPFFRDMIRILNPVFFEHYMPKTTWVFIHRYLDKVYRHVLAQIGRVVDRGRELRTLSGDGVLVANEHYNNYTIGHQGRVVFKDSVRQLAPNTKEYHCEQWLLQLRKDVDGALIDDARVTELYCAIVGDNVHYMRESGEMVEVQFPQIFAIGCLAHLFDKLCEDIAKIPEIAEAIRDNEKIVLCGKNIEDKVLAPIRKDSPWQSTFRTYPDTRFGYAGDMLDSVNCNQPLLHMATTSSSQNQPMMGYTSRDKTPSKAHKHCEFMAEKIQNSRWCKRNRSLRLLWHPIQLIIAFIGGGHARCAFVLPLIMALIKQFEAWQALSNTITSMKAETITEVVQALLTRYGGTTWRTDRTRKVGIKSDVHLFASATFPHTMQWNDEGVALLAPGTKEACRRVVSRFIKDGPSKDGEVAIIMDELNDFWQREGEWQEGIKSALFDTEAKLGKMYHDTPDGEPSDEDFVIRMIHRCTVATDPRKWVGTQTHASPTLRRMLNRVHSIEPASIGPERINKYLKNVMTPSRTSLRSDRVVKAVFVYANLRFLNKVANIDQTLLDFLVDAPELDMSIDEVAQLEHETKVLALEQEPIIDHMAVDHMQ